MFDDTPNIDVFVSYNMRNNNLFVSHVISYMHLLH